MDSARRQSATQRIPGLKALAVLNVVILFDPQKVSRDSLHMISDFIGNFSGAIELYCHLFTFDSFGSLLGAQYAQNAGATADLIIIAVPGDQELPTTVKRWLQKCVAPGSPHSTAIVALLEFTGLEQDIECCTREFLCSLAQGSTIDLFLHELEPPIGGFPPN